MIKGVGRSGPFPPSVCRLASPMPPSDQAHWFAAEVRPHEPMLRAYLHKEFPSLSDDIDDVVQESHLRLLKARERGRIASAKSYLFAIARNVAIDIFRDRRGIKQISVNESAEFNVLEDETNVVEAASVQQEFALAIDAIDRLPGRCREIAVLRLLHGLSHREIAARLGLAEETVRVQVARAMKKCAHYLRERGVDRPVP